MCKHVVNQIHKNKYLKKHCINKFNNMFSFSCLRNAVEQNPYAKLSSVYIYYVKTEVY